MKTSSSVVLLTILALNTGLSEAQHIKQSTTGPASPAIYAPNGNVTVHNNFGIPKLADDFYGLGDKGSRRIAEQLRKGQFEEAQEAIEKSISRSRHVQDQIAFLRGAQAAVATARSQPLTAEKEYAAAVALAPHNCDYRSRWALLLSDLDRHDEAERAVDQDSPEVVNCLKRAKPIDRARLLYTWMELAFERRNVAAALKFSERVARALEELTIGTPGVLWDAAVFSCRAAGDVYSVSKGTAEFVRTSTRLGTTCKQLSLRAAKGNAVVGKIFSLNFGEPQDPQVVSIKWFEQQLAAGRAAPRIGELGFDEDDRAIYVGSVLSELGFNKLWSAAPNLREVKEHYVEAYSYLSSRTSLRRPNSLMAMAQLGLRVAHYNSLFPGRAIQLSPLNDMAALARSATTSDYERYPGICQAMTRLLEVVPANERSGIAEPAHAALRLERDRCIQSATRDGSLLRIRLTSKALSQDRDRLFSIGELSQALVLADEVVRQEQLLGGFPRHAELRENMQRAFSSRAAIRSAMGNADAAYEDLMQAVALAEKTQLLHVIPATLKNAYVSHRKAWPLERASLAALGRRWLDASTVSFQRGHHCFQLAEVLEAGQFSATAALQADNVIKAIESLNEVMEQLKSRESCKKFVRTDNDQPNIRVENKINIAVIDLTTGLAAIDIESGRTGTLSLFRQVLEADVSQLAEAGIKLPHAALPLTSELHQILMRAREMHLTQ